MSKQVLAVAEKRLEEVKAAPFVLKAAAADKYAESMMSLMRDICNRLDELESK
ncbi:hypothetical protein [Kordiimonas sp.]|uniref:hypothetical protein n=1 Tax=Kordiimonas sp. TaxID=1970157 RepID=UPI003B516C22